MSLFESIFGFDLFGSSPSFDQYQEQMKNSQFHANKQWSDQLKYANQRASSGYYQYQSLQDFIESNNKNVNENKEVKPDPNVIDAEFEVIEIKELEFKK